MLTLGKVAWLWGSSPMHQSWAVGALMRYALPAIEFNQYFLLEQDGFPVGYCSWAFMSTPSEYTLIKHSDQLQAPDWKSGNRVWIVDWMAPFNKDHNRMLRNLVAEKFKDEVGRSFSVRPNRKNGIIKEHIGKNVPKQKAKEILGQYWLDFSAEEQRRKQGDLI